MNTTDDNIQERRIQRGGNTPDAILAGNVSVERYFGELESSLLLADNALHNMNRALVAMGNTSLGGVDSTIFQRNVSSIQEARPVVNTATAADFENVTQTGAYEPLRSEPPANQDAYSAAVFAINDPTKPQTPATNESAARDVVGAIFAEAEAKAHAEIVNDAAYIANGINKLENFVNTQTLENA